MKKTKVLSIGLVLLVAVFGVAWISWGNSTSAEPVHAQSGCVAAPSGMVSWWPGDGNADDIVDGSPGTLQGGATFAPGMVGQAFSFPGYSVGNQDKP